MRMRTRRLDEPEPMDEDNGGGQEQRRPGDNGGVDNSGGQPGTGTGASGSGGGQEQGRPGDNGGEGSSGQPSTGTGASGNGNGGQMGTGTGASGDSNGGQDGNGGHAGTGAVAAHQIISCEVVVKACQTSVFLLCMAERTAYF